METIIRKIRSCYDDMGRSEKKIADYIIENTQAITSMSISELAEKSQCGDATVVRFSRRLGLNGYQSLKITIAKELSSVSTIDSTIQKNDTCFEIFTKRVADINTSLLNTTEVLSNVMLEAACKKIMSAKKIVVFGLGNSASIAMDASHKLLRLGLNAQACCDNHMQSIIASHLSPGCVAIGISHSGSSIDIVEALRQSKEKGATTICITNFGTSPILGVSDISLFTRSEETKHSILAMSSRIAQLAILDAIYTYIVVNMNEESTKAIYNTEFSLQSKKY